jgi:hypothetical protein
MTGCREMMERAIGLFVTLAFCLAAIGGCSRSTGRQAIEGTVTLDGTPLIEGSIVFLPQPGTKSPTCGGTISQGRFSIAPAGGAACGTFRVEITAVRKTGKKVMNPKDNQLVDEIEQYIPAKYNGQSELTVTVSEQGPNRFDFPLSSK